MTDAPVREIMCTNVVVLFTGRNTENRHSERMSCNTQLKLLKQVRGKRGSKTTQSFLFWQVSLRMVIMVSQFSPSVNEKKSEFVCD